MANCNSCHGTKKIQNPFNPFNPWDCKDCSFEDKSNDIDFDLLDSDTLKFIAKNLQKEGSEETIKFLESISNRLDSRSNADKRVALVAKIDKMNLFSLDYDNYGQILFYTDCKVDKNNFIKEIDWDEEG